MYRGKTFKAIILAGGNGSRMQAEIPKQYLEVAGKPMLFYALMAFAQSPVDEIILVTAAGEEGYCRKNIIEAYQFQKVKHIVSGGRERYHSTKAGLSAAAECDYVLIHDAARPCVTEEVILRCMDAVIQKGACTTGMKTVDTIQRVDETGKILETPDRNYLWRVQTPQAFKYADITKAHLILSQKEEEMSGREKQSITDDVKVIEKFLKADVYMVEGSYQNIKVTTPEDIKIAGLFLGEEA